LELAIRHAILSTHLLKQFAIKELKEIAGIDSAWHTDREKPVLDEYHAILKTLNKESVDGDEFISLQKQLEDLKPLKDQNGQVEMNLAALRRERTTLLAEWEDVKMRDRRDWEGVAKRVSKKLAGSVQVIMGDENRALNRPKGYSALVPSSARVRRATGHRSARG